MKAYPYRRTAKQYPVSPLRGVILILPSANVRSISENPRSIKVSTGIAEVFDTDTGISDIDTKSPHQTREETEE